MYFHFESDQSSNDLVSGKIKIKKKTRSHFQSILQTLSCLRPRGESSVVKSASRAGSDWFKMGLEPLDPVKVWPVYLMSLSGYMSRFKGNMS